MVVTDFHDWFAAELDKKLASLPTDQSRYHHLTLQGNIWARFYDAYKKHGRQPFDHPHPRYGPMSAADFVVVLGMIGGRRMSLWRRISNKQPAREHT